MKKIISISIIFTLLFTSLCQASVLTDLRQSRHDLSKDYYLNTALIAPACFIAVIPLVLFVDIACAAGATGYQSCVVAHQEHKVISKMKEAERFLKFVENSYKGITSQDESENLKFLSELANKKGRSISDIINWIHRENELGMNHIMKSLNYNPPTLENANCNHPVPFPNFIGVIQDYLMQAPYTEA